MNVCIFGDSLTSLALAKNLINKKINVVIYNHKKNIKILPSRTIGVSKSNIEFFSKEIVSLKKEKAWPIKRIEIFQEKKKNGIILDFTQNDKSLFCLIKNYKLYELLNKELLKSKYFKKILIKDSNFYNKFYKKNNFNLIINCDQSNHISKKFFSQKFKKNYKSRAYTTIIEHKYFSQNNTAYQTFTKNGPIAFLPISNTQTSIVYSINFENTMHDSKKIINHIKKYNNKYLIKKINKIENFKLQSSNLRNYYFKNILAFGDTLHKIHPLAGQGFNMTLRDIKTLSQIIQKKIDVGLTLDSSVCSEFEKKVKHKNFIFSNGIDLIYEIFNFDRKIDSKNLGTFLKFLNKNKNINNLLTNFADKGINI